MEAETNIAGLESESTTSVIDMSLRRDTYALSRLINAQLDPVMFEEVKLSTSSFEFVTMKSWAFLNTDPSETESVN